MMAWDAAAYLHFAGERTRPAADLLTRVPLDDARRVVDLGCGPGNSTALLRARYPDAEIVGIDSSSDMLAQAREAVPSAAFVEVDIATWKPDAAPDLIFANAVLQWLPAHEHLLTRLMNFLAPGGCLAVQMPDNLDEPSHRLMRSVAAAGPWARRIDDAAAVRTRIAAPEIYYDWLCAAGGEVDAWTTIYRHPLADARAIVAWLKATGLLPFLAPLDAEARAGFLAAYEGEIARAYPTRSDRRVLLSFPRLFLVARRRP